MKKQTFMQHVGNVILYTLAILAQVLIVTILSCVYFYPSFFWLFVVTMVATYEVCRLSYLEIDFLGMATMPYQGISLGMYSVSFAVLHIFNWLGYIKLEVGWAVLGAVSLISLTITFLICWHKNAPSKEERKRIRRQYL